MFENIQITSATQSIAWPFSVGYTISGSSASWTSQMFTNTNIAGTSYSNLSVSANGTLQILFTDGGDVYIDGKQILRPIANIVYP